MSNAGVAGDFGSVTLSGNTNAKIQGERNQGVVSENSNLNLFSINCVLKVIRNSNPKINVQNCKLDISNCPNLALEGKGNTVTLGENSNAKFQGDGNQWEAKSNSNLNVLGTGSILKLFGNKNSKVTGNRCNVVAENNANLKVVGDDSKVSAKGTQNHELKPALADAELGLVNKLDISPCSDISRGGVGWISSMISAWSPQSNGNNAKFTVDYVDEAVIDHVNYNVGMFAFTVKGRSPTSYEVKVDETAVDPGSLVTRTIGPTEVILSATKHGVKQNLKVQGPSVQPQDQKTFNIELMQSNI